MGQDESWLSRSSDREILFCREKKLCLLCLREVCRLSVGPNSRVAVGFGAASVSVCSEFLIRLQLNSLLRGNVTPCTVNCLALSSRICSSGGIGLSYVHFGSVLLSIVGTGWSLSVLWPRISLLITPNVVSLSETELRLATESAALFRNVKKSVVNSWLIDFFRSLCSTEADLLSHTVNWPSGEQMS